MISKEEVEHIAKLSRIRLTEEEVEKFRKDFSDILDYIGLLKKAKVSKEKPAGIKTGNILRKDEAVPENQERVEKLIGLAPGKEGRQIKVKAILNG